MVDLRIMHGKCYVFYNDKLFIITVSVIYAVKMSEVLKDAA